MRPRPRARRRAPVSRTAAASAALERPSHPTTLISIARAALKNRLRQHETRSLFEELREGEARAKTIRYGLGAIKGTGEAAIEHIVEVRKAGGPYRDLFDFCHRVDKRIVNRRVVESLIRAGAFDGMTAFWQIPLILVVSAEGGRFLSGDQRFDWKPLLILAGALAGGIALHPNALNLLQMNWIHMVDVLFRNAWGNHVEFNMGEEFEPFSPNSWLEFMLPTAVMAGTAFYKTWRYRKGEAVAMSFALATMGFCLLTMRTNRFLEYFVPFTVLSLAMVSAHVGKKWLIPLLLVVSYVYTIATGVPLMKYLAAHDQKTWHFTPHVNIAHFPGMEGAGAHDERTWQMSSKTIAAFDRLLPRDTDVFTCGWEYTGSLLLNMPERDYMVALDPTLFYKRNPGLYNLWYRTMTDAPSTSAEIVRSSFASRYVVCLDHPTLHPFFDALSADKSARVMFSDGKWVLFDLGTGSEVAK